VTALAVVIGSATPPGRLHRALGEASARAADRHGLTVRTLDLGTLRIAPADGRPPGELGDDTAAALEAIAAADAVVLATPVYRGSLTGVLKNLLDHLPVEALRGTPTGIAAMGGSLHHYLGADRHLRDILTFFGALVTPTSAYLTSADFTDGVPGPGAAAQLDALLDGLAALAERLGDAPALGPPPLFARPG
jgi:FMN reductase